MLMKSFILNPLCAVIVSVIFLAPIFLFFIGSASEVIMDFTRVESEVITYMVYALSFIVIVWCWKAVETKEQKIAYVFSCFLWLCALLREAGIQHMLTQTDSTAFKIAFFRNPNNPLYEKIIAGALLALVAGVVGYLLIKYTVKIVKGFFKLDPFYWTICTLGVIGVIGKMADRIPGNYNKYFGERMGADAIAWFSLTEETFEALLPALFALALIQFYLMQKNTKKTVK